MARQPGPRDYWVTRSDEEAGWTFQDLTVRAGFFGHGCEAFQDRVYFEGSPLRRDLPASVDTVPQRSGDPVLPEDPVGTVGTGSLDLEVLSSPLKN